ncbi:hypothetical protein [Streptacidiphilus fuscans]|uniref:Alpha/beta hydrolase family protein n=1 Tax=Streptacidiphilus fuscans TaxID=2789292 RepID=A0A931FJK4_9ACTN|nr:hypothetical protein [Streptacidiphilus fuscans]MBF9072829.1 hypothetical protein [Streptacidiphilus fuscans]
MQALPAPSRELLLLAAADPTGDAALLWRAAALRGIDARAVVPVTNARLAVAAELEGAAERAQARGACPRPPRSCNGRPCSRSIPRTGPGARWTPAARAHAHTVEVNGPHLVMFTDPEPVADLIECAAAATAH